MIYHNRTRDVAAFWRFLLTVFLLTLSPIAFGQEGARRDEAIARLIQVQVDKAGSLLDENTLNTLILRFRKANPGVPESAWHEVKSDVKALFIRALGGPKGTFATTVREVMSQFSTEDIEKLVAIHSDPTYLRFNEVTLAAMKQPKAELSIRMAIEKTVVAMNDVVVKRGLNPAY